MLLRLLFPYMLLLLIVLFYIYLRYLKLGPVILKVKRDLFTRYSADSVFLVIILAAASYFLARFELQGIDPTDQDLLFGPLTFVYFYAALIVAVIAREVESPAIREKGISTSRGFWLWKEIDSFRWSKNLLTVTIARGKRKRIEVWPVKPAAKKELDLLLKKMVPKRSKQQKKKG